MLTPAERSALLRTVDRIAVELGGGAPDGPPTEDGEDELLAVGLRRSLAAVAAAAGGAPGAPEQAVGTALDAAEMVARGEIAMGNEARLPALLPVFVFLVTVPIVDLDRAIELSERCTRLLDGT